ncbi:unnamed protein product [Chrysoparadoxa australica]
MDGRTLSAEGSKLFRIQKTILKMLQNRGFVVSEEQINMTHAAFVERFGESPEREQLTLLVEKANDPSDQQFVFFPDDEKVGVKPIKLYSERMRDEKVSKAMIVVKGGLTSFAKTAIAELCKQRTYQVEDFRDAELMVDITEHVLVPKHEVLSEGDKQELLAKYKLKDNQLPRIQQDDPVARYYGLQKGQVVKITRPSETAGRYVTYRLCI